MYKHKQDIKGFNDQLLITKRYAHQPMIAFQLFFSGILKPQAHMPSTNYCTLKSGSVVQHGKMGLGIMLHSKFFYYNNRQISLHYRYMYRTHIINLQNRRKCDYQLHFSQKEGSYTQLKQLYQKNMYIYIYIYYYIPTSYTDMFY